MLRIALQAGAWFRVANAMSKYENKKTGDLGEEMASRYLIKQGYEIIKRNFRSKYSEVDIIAYKKPVLAFVEVKTKTSDQYGLPEEMVDDKKIGKIKNAIDIVLSRWAKTKLEEPIAWIDVISIIINRFDEVNYFKHIENFDN